MILMKGNVMPPLAYHFYYIANEIHVSNSKLLRLNRFGQLSEIQKNCK